MGSGGVTLIFHLQARQLVGEGREIRRAAPRSDTLSGRQVPPVSGRRRVEGGLGGGNGSVSRGAPHGGGGGFPAAGTAASRAHRQPVAA